MSTDVLLRTLEQAERSLHALRANPPLSAAIAVRECFDEAAPRQPANPPSDPFERLGKGWFPELRDEFAQTLADMTPGGERVDYHRTSGIHGHYAIAICVHRGTPEPARSLACLSYRGLAGRLVRVLSDLPPDVRLRLGYDDHFFGPNTHWERALFHLAWHFPSHFCNGAARRFRIIGERPHPTHAPEQWLQLWGARGNLHGPFHGLVFSVLGEALDLVTASECALQLMREALGGPTTVKEHRDENLRQLRMAFANQGETVHGMSNGGGRWDLDTWFLRVDSSFHTRPAAEWAGVSAGGDTQELLVLSRQCPAVEYCVLRGPWCERFLKLADLAGAQLPRWPSTPYPAPLDHMDSWSERLDRRRTIAAQTFEADLGDGRTRTVPGLEIADREWQQQDLFRGFRRTVTDDRGNAERWVGFVLDGLILRDPESLEVRLGPDLPHPTNVGPWNCVVTLPKENLFQASARVINWMFEAPTVVSDNSCTSEPEVAAATTESEVNQVVEPSVTGDFAERTEEPENGADRMNNARGTVDPAAFVFVASGDGFVIRGLGEAGRFVRLAGFCHLQQMVRTPGRAVPWGHFDPALATGGRATVQPTLETPELRTLRDHMDRVRAEIEATEDGSADRRDSERRLSELQDAVRAATGLGGRGRDLNSPIGRVRSRIWARLNTAFEKLRTADPPMPNLAAHLAGSVESGPDGFVYNPAPPVPVWKTEAGQE